MARTMRIAYLSPLAPLRTRVADYSEELLPHLCRRAQVDAYTDDRVAATQEVGRAYPLYGYRDLAAQRERYDQLIFQLASDPEHVPIYELFLRSGGVAVLHDLNLSELAAAGRAAQTDGAGPLREARAGGGLGPFLQTAASLLFRRPWQEPGDQEVMRLLGRQATGVIVSSPTARDALLARLPGVPVRHVPLGIASPPAIDAAEARQLLNLPAGAFVCLSLGPLDPQKRIHVAMQAFARLLERCPASVYVLIGELAPGYPLTELAQTLGIADRVRFTGYVDRPTLYRYLAACDVGIALRQPAAGQVSAGVLRIMSMGRPVVVSRCEPYTRWPGHCLLKVDAGPGEAAQLVATLWALSSHSPTRHWYGRRAAHFVQSRHSAASVARQYVDFLEELAAVAAPQVAERGA